MNFVPPLSGRQQSGPAPFRAGGRAEGGHIIIIVGSGRRRCCLSLDRITQLAGRRMCPRALVVLFHYYTAIVCGGGGGAQ